MKQILASLISLFFIGIISAAAQAEITFNKSVHDFGKFQEKDAQVCTFTFTNTGDEPLIIHQAFSTCGCTVANYTKEPVQPGQKGELKVTYNGRGKFPGNFKKTITVRSNAKKNNMVRLTISGNMVEDQK